jgi:hypothetical protein
MQDPARSSRARRATLLAAIALALVVLAALPAAAAANATSLTLVASPTVTPFGGTAVLTGTLMDTSGVPVALGGQPVFVWSSPTGTFPGTLLAIITTGTGTPAYDTGTYTLTVAPVNKTYYMMTFAANGIYEASSSDVVAVTPRVYVSKPSVPSSARLNRRFKIVNYLQPRHTAGARNSVKFKAYRFEKGKWVLKRAAWARNANFLKMTRCTATMTLKQRGYWSVRAYAPADAKHAATTSAWSRTFKVQ